MADLDKIQEIVEKTDGKVSELCIGVAEINQRCLDRLRIMDGHTRTLYGDDGTAGVVARQNKVVEKLQNMNGVAKEKHEWSMRILAPVISQIIIAVILAIYVIWKTQK